MYEFLRGKVTSLNPASVVIDTGSIGFFVNISLNTYSKINGKNEALLLLHQVVRDDAHIFYGFAEKNERELFRNLITVSGVGAATAIMMLSSLTPDEVVAAITTGNTGVLKTVKGIGIKTAQRIIIDLKDKLGKVSESSQFLLSADNTPVSYTHLDVYKRQLTGSPKHFSDVTADIQIADSYVFLSALISV